MSFEYMLLFVFALMIFIVIGTVIYSNIQKTRQLESDAQYLAKQIKATAIIASLSETDIETNITLPTTLSQRKVYVDIYKYPDNIVEVKEEDMMDNPEFIAKEFLPIIDPTGGNLENLSGDTITIRKQGNNITISVQ